MNFTEAWHETKLVIEMIDEMQEHAVAVERGTGGYEMMSASMMRIRDLSRQVKDKSASVTEFLESLG